MLAARFAERCTLAHIPPVCPWVDGTTRSHPVLGHAELLDVTQALAAAVHTFDAVLL